MTTSNGANTELEDCLRKVAPVRSWVRFLLLWSKIKPYLDRGITIRDVHAGLLEDGLWTGGYDVFRRHVAKARRTENLDVAKSTTPEAASPVASLSDTERHPPRSGAHFLLLWPKIKPYLDRGITIRDVHAGLLEDGHWVGEYGAFRRHVAQARRLEEPARLAKPSSTDSPHLTALERFQPRSGARIRALWPQIKRHLDRGLTVRDVHATLQKAGLWPSGYESFRAQVAQLRAVQKSTATPPPTQQVSARPGTPQRAPATTPSRKVNPLLVQRERDPVDYSKLLSPEMLEMIKPRKR